MLKYESVREVVGDGLVRYEIDAVNPEWPSAYLVLAPEPESGKHVVLQAGFGEWHKHFDEYRNPDRNVGAALAFLAEVVSGRVRIVAGYDAKGLYVGGELVRASVETRNMVHHVLGTSEAVSFKSFEFNCVPEDLAAQPLVAGASASRGRGANSNDGLVTEDSQPAKQSNLAKVAKFTAVAWAAELAVLLLGFVMLGAAYTFGMHLLALVVATPIAIYAFRKWIQDR